MKHSRGTVESAVTGGLMVAVVAIFVVGGVAQSEVTLGFPAVILVTTGLLAGAHLLAKAGLHWVVGAGWLAPVAYALAASIWLTVTPRAVGSVSVVEQAILELGPQVGLSLLFLPIVFAALRGRLATMLLAGFVALTIGMVGAFYIPALLASVVTRATSSPTMPAISAS